jgi:hypothetical protein
MSRSGSVRWRAWGAAAVAGGALLAPALAAGWECISGPLPGQPGLPGNPNNRIVLCSPTPAEVSVGLAEGAVLLAWPARPPGSAFVSAIEAGEWIGVDSAAVVPTMRLTGVYQSLRDRRVELTVEGIDSTGVASVDSGFIGRDRVRVRWTSIHDVEGGTVVGGLLELPVNYVSDSPLRFEVPNVANPTLPPDTTALAGLRIRFRSGDPVRLEDRAIFDVEDFEGWHVWRWGADPTSTSYLAVGEASFVAGSASPPGRWFSDGTRVYFADANVFDGFVYHYAITSYDQGFRRSSPGDLATKFDSPVAPATDVNGTVTLGSTQFRVDYRRLPAEEFEPIAAVPNPFRSSEYDPSRPETGLVYFVNAPARGTLYIWTVSGDLVLKRDHDQPTVGTITWDTRNEAGQEVGSGVYIFKIVDLGSGQESYGRLAVIR